MNSSPDSSNEAARNLLCAVLDEGRFAIVRVIGRGNFSNSMALKNFATLCYQRQPKAQLVIDLQQCDAMDSTFMGVVAGIAIANTRKGAPKIVVTNASDHCRRLLRNLGLASLLDFRAVEDPHADQINAALAPATPVAPSRLEQICLTLQAHKELVAIDEQNGVRFQAVIEYLEKSLAEENG
jgi:anti-anti-sigma factor